MASKNTQEQVERAKSNLVEIAETIKNGDLPSNSQLKEELEPAKEILAEKEQKATTKAAEEALRSTRKLVEAVQETLEAKNPNDRFQKLVDAVGRVVESTSMANSPTALKQDAKEFATALNSVVFELGKSKEFRQSLLDLFKLIQDVFEWTRKGVQPQEKAEQAFVSDEKSMKEAGKEIKEETKEKLKNIPEEKKQQFRERVRDLLRSVQKLPDSSYAFQKFLKLWSLVNAELCTHVERAKVDKDLREVEDLSIDLLQSLAGGKSLTNLLAAIQNAFNYIQVDDKLNRWLRDCRDFILKALDNPELIEQDSFYDEADRLFNEAKELADKYKDNVVFQNVIDEANEFIEAIKQDEQLSNLKYRAEKVVDAFTTTDAKGNPQLNFDLINTMRKELAPFLIDRIKELPIPGFRIENKDFEYLQVDDLYLTVDDILPDKISIHARNDMDISVKDFENPVKAESVVKFKMEGLRPKFKDFHFSFKRKGDLVNLQDEGRANLKLGGKGLCLYITFDLDLDADNRALLGKFKVDVTVDTIDIDITKAEHKILLNMFTSLFSPKVHEGIEASLKTRIQQIGGDWALYINKKVLSTLPNIKTIGHSIAKAMPTIGQTVTNVIVNP